MSTLPMTKMFLKNTTKMSLNDRFTAYRQQAQTQATFRQKVQRQRQATAESRRLAQQMANRPSVIAALRLKKKSMQQRLGRNPAGGNIKARLNLTGRTNTSSLRNRLGNVRGVGVRRGGFRPGTSPLIKARLGTPSGSSFGAREFRQPQRMGRRGRGNSFRQARGGYNSMLRRSSPNKALRGKAGFQGGRGRGRWNKGGVPALPTRQELDNQLDEYMAETKGSYDVKPEF